MKFIKILALFFVINLFTGCKVKRCKIKSCQTRMIHAHGSKEFTGMPWWKKKNPQTGDGYGEFNMENKKK